MKGILQYSSDDSVFKNVGTERAREDHEYTVTAIDGKDWSGNPVVIGYRVAVQAKVLELNTDFLDETEWYFRFQFAAELTMVKLGERSFTLESDFQIPRNTIIFHYVRLQFDIAASEIADYIEPESLPESEGGIYIDDGGLYID